jgi:hypothetical protein
VGGCQGGEAKGAEGTKFGLKFGVTVGKEGWVCFGAGRLVAPGHVTFEVAGSRIKSLGEVTDLAGVEPKGGELGIGDKVELSCQVGKRGYTSNRETGGGQHNWGRVP